MKGTVGSGKTFYSRKLQEAVEGAGGACLVVGTDKYCVRGMTTQDAVLKITEDLQGLDNFQPGKALVVVVDTCGERDSGNTSVFGINLAGWKRVVVFPNYDRAKLEGYLAWTLRNVLRRGEPAVDSDFYLSPTTAGLRTCVEVHAKKAKALFGKKTKLPFSATPATVEAALDQLEGQAAEYQKFLEESMPWEKKIEELVKSAI
jgi:hypothetical protein